MDTIKKKYKITGLCPLKGQILSLVMLLCLNCTSTKELESRISTISGKIYTDKPLLATCDLEGSKTKKVNIVLTNLGTHGSLSITANDKLLVDNLNIPDSGNQVLNTLVRFNELGKIQLRLNTRDADMVIHQLTFEDIGDLNLPIYEDISEKAGLDKVSSIKYGGPTVADMDQDGDYDFIVNNHNEETSKLYWNNGDGTVTKHNKNLARWFMHDLHGTALRDYDNDGDLDLILTQGGGNGKNPSKANFYKNDDSNLIRFTGDVGINRGGRGRGARWSDMDLDGDLDFMLINELGLKKEKPQHFFYENLGDGTFRFKSVEGIQDVHPSRALITDLNADNIDDIILYGPLSIWLGNGDFTFTDVTSKALQNLPEYDQVMAIADLDIDNDGDLDLYLARGRAFEGGFGESPSLDSDPIRKEMSIRSRGYKGVDEFDFVTDGKIKLHNYYYLSQGPFRGEVYSVFLGNTKRKHMLKSAEELQIDSTMAKGWPQDISKNGLYFGYLGQNKWKAALVRNGNLFWSYRFSLAGVTDVSPKFRPQNRNEPDILLRNDDGVFTDVSKSWNLPPGGNALGVTVGDFNNDSHQDVFVYRWGFIGSRTSDYMLLNTGKGNFETVTRHGANDIGGPGNGDMGQTFDFDLDGDLDLLNGSEGGEWYLYENKLPGTGNSILVRVGYAPESNVDAIAAEVIVKTPEQEYRKRVGSAGEVFSQSLMNIVHFGLGDATSIERVQVRWRNGETIAMHDMPINNIIDTDNVHPKSINIVQKKVKVRKGTSMQLATEIEPINANKEVVWSSSDTEVLQVDTSGMVTAIGDVGQTATITAKSAMNDLLATCEVAIVDWFSMPIEKVELNQSDLELVENQKVNLQTTVIPKYADDPSLNWKSTDATAAKVDENGVITALKSGETTIKVTSNANNAITDTIQVTVKPVVEPYAKILNKEQLEQPIVGNSITVTAKYHAGTGNTVINADEGGVRIWLRHFKNEWFPIKDVVLVDEKALNTVSGQVTQTFSLKDYIPTAKLPEGQFYQLRVTFTASDGNMYDDVIYPLNIVEKEKTP